MDRGLTQRLEAAATLEEPGRLFGRKCRCSASPGLAAWFGDAKFHDRDWTRDTPLVASPGFENVFPGMHCALHGNSCP